MVPNIQEVESGAAVSYIIHRHIPLSQERHIHPLPSLSYIRSMALVVEFLHDQVAVGCALLSLGCPNK